MRLRVIVKLGTIMSVLLFCMTLAYYAFMRLDMTERNRSVNLYSMVPAKCVAVMESDDIDRLLDDALVRFDDRRLKNILALLQQMAQQRQILLFTCQGREKALTE